MEPHNDAQLKFKSDPQQKTIIKHEVRKT